MRKFPPRILEMIDQPLATRGHLSSGGGFLHRSKVILCKCGRTAKTKNGMERCCGSPECRARQKREANQRAYQRKKRLQAKKARVAEQLRLKGMEKG